VAAPSHNVTADIIDRAVEEVLQDAQVTPEVAHVMRNLLSSDASSAVAHAYYHGVASGFGVSPSAVLEKPRLDIPYALTDAQVAALSAYAPDFSLRFSARELHDHPVAAACRMVDRAVVQSRVPPGVMTSDVGGALVHLVSSGAFDRGVHACAPLVDPKDPVRHVLSNLQLRKMSQDPRRSEACRLAASRVLAGDPALVCRKRVQDCDYVTPVITSVHVYDVPIGDWPGIMERKKAQLVEGCMLFPRDLFKLASSEMPVAGARYEVDVAKDEFRMGFTDSPAWWYQHRLSEYLKYGVDQILSSDTGVYSYKIVERRGDTLFFRILKVGPNTLPEYRQTYRLPGVPMVRVSGFPVHKKHRSLWEGARRTYLFPEPLWNDMLAHAKEMVERGTLTPERLFNYYRTVAPRQSINAVVVAGGSTVSNLNELVPLIVHVVLFAFAEVRKVQIESTAIVDEALRSQRREREWTLYKLLAAFGSSLLGTTSLTCAPLLWVGKLVGSGIDKFVSGRAFEWQVEAVVQEVSAKLILARSGSGGNDITAQPFGVEDMASAAPADVVRAAAADGRVAELVLEGFSSVLPTATIESLRKALPEAPAEESPPPAAPVGEGSVPEVTVSKPGTVHTADVDETEVLRRRAAILEAIDECEAEAAKSEAACAEQFRELFTSGAPDKRKLLVWREVFGNPEFWHVTAGIVDSSFSGAPVDGFLHAAVYCPVPFEGSRLLAVTEEEYKGMSQGEYVERVWYKIANPTYTGWVYTNDSLLIHNGPAVAQAMREALDLPLDFSIVLNQGPPGCGKTSQIVTKVRADDVVLVPVRKSVRETAERIRQRDSKLAKALEGRVRTLDSYLVNVDRNKRLKSLRAGRLLADEAFMAREGRWLAAAARLGVTVIEAFGDREQIPHVPRAECPKNYVSLRYQVMEEVFVSYRCPPQLVACWGHVYNWRVRSASRVEGLVRQVGNTSGLEIPAGCAMMGMYQADKKILQQMYGGCGVPVQIMTVHESQGNTYKTVWLHRFDNRRRTDRFSLYDRQEYVLVAMSRSTHEFTYVSPPLGDLVSQWISQGKDLRRVAAAADTKSAGTSIEFM